ncbi:MAG: trypsin-like peptidase domain-containing protein [Patescibacteria group bacterium]
MDQSNSKVQKIIIVSVIIILFVAIIFGALSGILGSYIYEKYIIANNELTKNSGKQATVVQDEESAVISAVEKAGPAVVSIVISKDVPTFEEYFDQSNSGSLFGPLFMTPQYRQNGTEKQDVGAGTGFIVSNDGYILTNKHVVSDNEASYAVFLSTGEKYDAKLIAQDDYTDFAVLKIEGQDFPAVELGDSANLKSGQSVIAIGYALGELKNTVSKGVVSGLGRSITAGDMYGQDVEKLENIIQTDAAINHGNSGGPLLNINGQVIGINVAVSEVGENIGFALSINDVKNLFDTVKENGKIVRPYLGIRYEVIDEALQTANNLSVDYGVLVRRGDMADQLAVVPGSPADKAGIEENDILLEIDGQKINTDNSLQKILYQKIVGDKINIKLLHDGKDKQVDAILEVLPDL